MKINFQLIGNPGNSPSTKEEQSRTERFETIQKRKEELRVQIYSILLKTNGNFPLSTEAMTGAILAWYLALPADDVALVNLKMLELEVAEFKSRGFDKVMLAFYRKANEGRASTNTATSEPLYDYERVLGTWATLLRTAITVLAPISVNSDAVKKAAYIQEVIKYLADKELRKRVKPTWDKLKHEMPGIRINSDLISMTPLYREIEAHLNLLFLKLCLG